MSLPVLLEKFGGSVTINMNGRSKFLGDLTARGALIVQDILYAGITVCKPKILNCPRNGIQPRTEVLHQRILQPVTIIKLGGCAAKVMTGKLLLKAELRELDALFA